MVNDVQPHKTYHSIEMQAFALVFFPNCNKSYAKIWMTDEVWAKTTKHTDFSAKLAITNHIEAKEERKEEISYHWE